MLRYFKNDILRYKELTNSSPFKEPSIYFLFLFRLGQSINKIKIGILRKLINLFYNPFYKLVSVYFGISLPRSSQIDSGFVIFHYGAIAINENAKIGKNVTIRQGVTIGNKSTLFDVPIIRDNVDIGAGAAIIGEIKIGNNVKIGANAVVLKNIPDDATAVGIPANIKLK